MAFVCFVYVCDVHHIDKRGLCMLLTCIRGEAWPRVPPPPLRAERRLGYPQANFLFFSTLPHNIIHLPILFVSERFSLPLCVFPYPCIFSCLWGQKKRGKYELLFLFYLCLCGYYAPYSHSTFLFSVIFPYCSSLCTMFLHCLLLWMLCFSLICLFFCPLWGFLRFCV